ncbi:MAG: Nitrilase/cyanide hydratase and apolipoprotein N-acyltransferase [Bacteroidetes bacterium]|jgi:predicted amidohydrolase|nr:Nitrilase/cyanide hydratase and apolipoprotein N-acyltransferase [Bacteroidota bacterium]
MKITLIQTSLYWENREKNIAHFDALIASIKEETDLIILPEMFTTGFTMNPEKQAEPWNGATLEWMKQKAREKNAVVTGSVSVEENKKYFNRLLWAEPNGNVSHYDKRHLFRMGKEDQHYSAGKTKIITKIRNWNICPLICYDLRFPVWSRNKFNAKDNTWQYDVLIFVANWPEVRIYPWKQLLIARAIENQCYVIGVNRIGKDGNDIAHSGDSLVINPRGEIINKTKTGEESIETVVLDRNYLEDFRKIFPVGMDADTFEI